jgi:hypothetical protein
MTDSEVNQFDLQVYRHNPDQLKLNEDQKEILELKLYNKRLTEEFSRSSNDYINNNQFSGMVSRNFSKSN